MSHNGNVFKCIPLSRGYKIDPFWDDEDEDIVHHLTIDSVKSYKIDVFTI